MIADSLSVLNVNDVGCFSVLTKTGGEHLLAGTSGPAWFVYRSPRDRGILTVLYGHRTWLLFYADPERPIEVGARVVLPFERPRAVQVLGRDLNAGTYRVGGMVEAIFVLYGLPSGITMPESEHGSGAA